MAPNSYFHYKIHMDFRGINSGFSFEKRTTNCLMFGNDFGESILRTDILYSNANSLQLRFIQNVLGQHYERLNIISFMISKRTP
jgi:hypothetical protein